TIDKIAPPTAVLGRPMVYHIEVRNVGSISAHQVVVEDVVPPGLKIDGSIPQARLNDGRLIWKLGTLAPGQQKKISVKAIPQAEGTLSSVATVNFSGDADSPASTPASSVPASNGLQSNTPGPKLKFDVIAPRQAAVGTPIE